MPVPERILALQTTALSTSTQAAVQTRAALQRQMLQTQTQTAVALSTQAAL